MPKRPTRRRMLAAIAGLVAVGGLGGYTRARAAHYYDGPVSDHFDGVRFFDPNGAPPKAFGDLLRWTWERQRAPWPEWTPGTVFDTPPQRVEGAACRVSFIGHVTLLVQTAGLNILTDPVFSDRASPFSFAGPRRVTDPGIRFEDLPPIDIVLVTHNHYDHLDTATLSRLAAAHDPRVVTPLGNDTIMRAADSAIRAESYDWHQHVDLGAGCTAIPVPTRHWSARGMFDRNKALWASFVIETPAGKIYFVGDSGYGDGYHFRSAGERYGPFRLACLPIGAYEPRWFMRDQHMNPEEAVKAFADCRAERALGTHFGTFQLTDESFEAPLAALAEARSAAGLTPEQFGTLRPGEILEL